MKKSEIAGLLNKSINLYSDYIKTGFLDAAFETYDFGYFDKEPEKETKRVEETATDIEDKIRAKEVNSEFYNRTPVGDEVIRKRTMIKLASEISKCSKCSSFLRIGKAVSGFGNSTGGIFVISDYPNSNDEKEGFPLSGEVGDFFRKWIDGIKLDYNKIFLTTVVKCAIEGKSVSSENFKDIIENCIGYLSRQLEIVKPAVIFVLGENALSSLYKKNMPIKERRGKILSYLNYPLLATYNPKEVLKNSELKKNVWEDLKILKAFYDEKVKNG
ncbi:MAG TPA: uracil-DNA glycosylase [Spirochaetota bacterium]|nr:uracil-DNA glycosylase [Spirochaetota bacterium]